MSTRGPDQEQGFVLIWMGIMLTMLLAATGFAVEWNHLNREGARMQKAADAAALGGAVYLPEHFTSGDPNARDTALEVAARNGYANDTDGISVAVELDGDPTILRVTITKEVPNLLGKAIGSGTMTIDRSARAQFRSPLSMGSPGSHYGNDPERLSSQEQVGVADGPYPNFWGKISGGFAKHQGEVKLAEMCGSLAHEGGADADLCPDNVNQDFSREGWIYEIEVRDAGPVTIEIYDPAWVNDLYCGQFLADHYSAATELDAEDIPGYPQDSGIDPSDRYAAGRANPFCTQNHRVFFEKPWTDENHPAHIEGSFESPPLWTSYTLHGPGANFAAAPDVPACTADFPGIARTDHGAAPLPIHDLLTGAVPITDFIDSDYHSVPADLPPFGAYFRAWWELCTFQADEPGTYYLQVLTPWDAAGNDVPGAAQTSASNHHAIRAYDTDTGPSGDSPVSVGGWGMMQAWMGTFQESELTNESEFFLLRLEPADHARRLVISAFDLGAFTCQDSDDPEADPEGCELPVELTVKPPSDPNAPPVFDSCTYTDPVGREPVDSRPLPNVTEAEDCAIPNVGTPFGSAGNDNWARKWVDIVVEIPEEYDCLEAEPDGCWLRLHYAFDPNQRLHDGVAITASVDGDPVRLLR